MDKLTVAVSGMNAVDNPGPGVGVARSLKEASELDVEIVGIAYDAMEPGIYLDWVVDRSFIVPYPSSGHQAYLDRLLYIKEETGLDFIIPTLDTEMPFFMRYQDELASHGIQTFVPSTEQYRLRGKDRLAEVAKATDLVLPRTEVVSSAEDLAKAVDSIGLPVMVKGAFYKAYKAETSQEAVSNYHKIVAEWGYPVIVQEVVRGEELNVVAVGDGKGGTLGQVGVKKMWITELGKIWTGVTVLNQPMLEATRSFIETYRWKGPFELECMADGDDLYLIEINPRFPAWSYFATGVGVNLPSRMVKFAMGEEVGPAPTYEAGKLFIRYTYELISDIEPFQRLITAGEL